MNLFLLELFRYIFLFLIYFFLYKVIVIIRKDIYSTEAKKSPSLIVIKSDCEELFPGKKLSLIPPLTIGKSNDNDIVINNSYISNKQVSFSCKEGEIWIEDIKSTNGTLINESPLKKPRLLKNKDVINLAGAVIMEFRKV